MATKISHLIGETTDYDKKQQLEVNRPKSWCKSVSAFANGRGGALFFGIADDNCIVGLDNPQLAAEKFSEIVKTKLDPVPEFSLSFEAIDDKTVMVVRVEPGSLTPYYYMGDGQQIAFYRLGNESVPATANILRELVLRGSHQSYDSLVSDYKFGNYAFTKLRSVFHARTGNDFTDSDYESWGLVTADGRLTNAGALLADESPMRNSRLFCTRWNGLDQAHGIMDALDDMEVSGSLVILLQEGLDFCRRNSKKMWHKTPAGRVELPSYPEQSILEALVNALIHRSYIEIGGEVHIDIFDDRIEISSPGGMYENNPVQDCDIMCIRSRRRNPILADIFSRLKYMERRGSGFKKICQDYSRQPHYRAELHPKFYSDNYDFVITLYNLNYKAMNTAIDSVPQSSPKFPKVPQSSPISDETLSQFLTVLGARPDATVEALAGEAQVTERMVKKYLQALKERGMIRRVGSNRRGRWEIL
ncbi:MAG: ATP-binding protein [Muribaculaceae bacterium]